MHLIGEVVSRTHSNFNDFKNECWWFTGNLHGSIKNGKEKSGQKTQLLFGEKNLTLIFSLQFVCLFVLTPEITSIGLKAVQFIH